MFFKLFLFSKLGHKTPSANTLLTFRKIFDPCYFSSRRSLPASMMGIGLDEEEEKEEEDNQSIVSYFSGLGYDQDHIPTRDTGIMINSFIFLRSWI